MLTLSLNIPKTVVLQILQEDSFLLHNNVPACKASSVYQFLSPNNVTTLYRRPPPPTPDLSLPDYLQFPKLKMKLKGFHFADVAEIQEAVMDELKKVQKQEFLAAFQKLYNHTKACIYANGAYFEFKKKVMFLLHVFSMFKNISPKTCGPHCVHCIQWNEWKIFGTACA
jgi:hypothetical protein